jgi:type IV pilus assembly protein PilB
MNRPRDPGGAPPKPLGERLVEAGVITPQQLAFALKEQARTGQLLGEIIVAHNFASEASIGEALSGQSGEAFDDLSTLAPDPDALGLLPEAFVRMRQVLPLSADADGIRVAMVDTFDVETIDEVGRVTARDVSVVGCPRAAFFEALRACYGGESDSARFESSIEVAGRDLAGEPGERVDEAPIITLVEELIAKGVQLGATDIHLQPGENLVHVRYRVDGVLRLGETVPKDLQSAVESRIKVMAHMDISERRRPQDGRIQTEADGRRIDLRVSTVPAMEGENIVLRVLDREKVVVRLDEVGFSSEQRTMFRQAVARPNGIVLVTGPTGSGKTTTLYAGLLEIDALEKNIMTLEDPVEYRIPVIRQTQVNPRTGYTFATGLRALLRQDPDVILVGEIRDPETAELAARAAMTGHLVLSTLHTNDAASALPRLIDMGVAPYLLPSTIIAVLSQRLVRRPCAHCKVPMTPDPEEFASFARDPEPGAFVTATGCPRCNQTGYSGRLPIAEFLCMSPAVTDLVMARASASAITEAARREGMVDIRQDGYEKARRGDTTLAEVRRVAERRLMLRPPDPAGDSPHPGRRAESSPDSAPDSALDPAPGTVTDRETAPEGAGT